MTWILLIATLTLIASLSVSVHRAQTEAHERLCDCITHHPCLRLAEGLPASSVVPFPTGRIPSRPRPARRTIPVRHRPLRPVNTPSGLRPAG